MWFDCLQLNPGKLISSGLIAIGRYPKLIAPFVLQCFPDVSIFSVVHDMSVTLYQELTFAEHLKNVGRTLPLSPASYSQSMPPGYNSSCWDPDACFHVNHGLLW